MRMLALVLIMAAVAIFWFVWSFLTSGAAEKYDGNWACEVNCEDLEMCGTAGTLHEYDIGSEADKG
jgi:hypothetical protein